MEHTPTKKVRNAPFRAYARARARELCSFHKILIVSCTQLYAKERHADDDVEGEIREIRVIV